MFTPNNLYKEKENMIYNEHLDSGAYGIEAMFDFHNCDTSKFTAESLVSFVNQIIEIADMQAHGDPLIWEDNHAQELHLQGTSVFQFIKTSNIVIHTMTITGLALLNLFSCKTFDPDKVLEFGKEYFQSDNVKLTVVHRGEPL